MTSLIGQPKSFASLSSTLLARKGHARPAMRSQGYAGFGGAGFGAAPDAGDDLGWNDMGHATPAEPVASPVPPVLRQREVLREELSGPVAVEAPPPDRPTASIEIERAAVVRAAVGSKGKAAFTLRLDSARHLRLRLASALANRSAQQIVCQALDAYLETVPDLEDMAAHAASRPDSKTDMGE
ncbi:MAG: hypothetical protein H2054_05285 [Sphingomonas sp.]|uniref:hypothetical protein n=1 Tax=Sphingomonas sp. TaxID=28214 RepID=UPI000DB4058E|nr:hypothetical protein [Sphingomonas sp.]MBA4772507.1 hypothetical protein [Sphingomonas sp.]PZP12892.1 MAG: hypothetical protein DI607_09025 [Sphingomonas hengshuiensis]